MNLRSIDLNLLVIFDALLAESSVSHAASRLGLTQSAVSHALKRLRQTFDDELFVRAGGGLAPTARAVEVAEPLRQALDQIERAVKRRGAFDPSVATRTFGLRLTDYVSSALLEAICPLLRREAPGISLKVAQFTGRPRDDEIIGDEIHVRFAASPRVEPPYNVQELLREPFVVVWAAGNAAAAEGPMTLDRYARLPHVKVAGTIGTNMIDDALAQRGLKRNVVFQVPGWRDARHIVRNSDLIATIPARWARAPAEQDAIATAACPLDDVVFAIDLVWHGRYDQDPGHAWLRRLIIDQFGLQSADTV